MFAQRGPRDRHCRVCSVLSVLVLQRRSMLCVVERVEGNGRDTRRRNPRGVFEVDMGQGFFVQRMESRLLLLLLLLFCPSECTYRGRLVGCSYRRRSHRDNSPE